MKPGFAWRFAPLLLVALSLVGCTPSATAESAPVLPPAITVTGFSSDLGAEDR